MNKFLIELDRSANKMLKHSISDEDKTDYINLVAPKNILKLIEAIKNAQEQLYNTAEYFDYNANETLTPQIRDSYLQQSRHIYDTLNEIDEMKIEGKDL